MGLLQLKAYLSWYGERLLSDRPQRHASQLLIDEPLAGPAPFVGGEPAGPRNEVVEEHRLFDRVELREQIRHRIRMATVWHTPLPSREIPLGKAFEPTGPGRRSATCGRNPNVLGPRVARKRGWKGPLPTAASAPSLLVRHYRVGAGTDRP